MCIANAAFFYINGDTHQHNNTTERAMHITVTGQDEQNKPQVQQIWATRSGSVEPPIITRSITYLRSKLLRIENSWKNHHIYLRSHQFMSQRQFKLHFIVGCVSRDGQTKPKHHAPQPCRIKLLFVCASMYVRVSRQVPNK